MKNENKRTFDIKIITHESGTYSHIYFTGDELIMIVKIDLIEFVKIDQKRAAFSMASGSQFALNIKNGWDAKALKKLVAEIPGGAETFKNWIDNHSDSELVNDFAIP